MMSTRGGPRLSRPPPRSGQSHTRWRRRAEVERVSDSASSTPPAQDPSWKPRSRKPAKARRRWPGQAKAEAAVGEHPTQPLPRTSSPSTNPRPARPQAPQAGSGRRRVGRSREQLHTEGQWRHARLSRKLTRRTPPQPGHLPAKPRRRGRSGRWRRLTGRGWLQAPTGPASERQAGTPASPGRIPGMPAGTPPIEPRGQASRGGRRGIPCRT